MTAPDPRLDEIQARLDAATPGPWGWFGNTDTKNIYLATPDRGRQFIMTFRRWGMQGAQPWFNTDMMMAPASDRPRYEVAPAAESRDDPRVYRADVSGIKHPDAEFIANAPADVAYLLAELRKAREALADAKAERGWLAKTRNTDGSVAIIGHFKTEAEAEKWASKYPASFVERS